MCFRCCQRNERVASDDADVLGFLTLAAGADVELDALTLFQGAVARALDGREVDENVGAVLTGDEAVALLRVEPFHTACRQRLAPSILRSCDLAVRATGALLFAETVPAISSRRYQHCHFARARATIAA